MSSWFFFFCYFKVLKNHFLTQKAEKSGDWRIGSDVEVDLKAEKFQ